MNNNQDQWEDARKFKPERFLNEEGMFCKNENLLAFSIGKALCQFFVVALNDEF
jgi:hypothetical protein